MRNPARLIVALVLLCGGCRLFSPDRPTPPDMRMHVVIIGVEGLTPQQLDPERTPNLFAMARHGVAAWDITAGKQQDPVAVYRDILTGGTGRSVLDLCREANESSALLIRNDALAALAGPETKIERIHPSSPAIAASYAAARFIAQKPGCMFVQLGGAAADPIEQIDRGLGQITAGIRRANAADRTTIILVSAKPLAAMFSGPYAAAGLQLDRPVSAADIFETAAASLLLHKSSQGAAIPEAFNLVPTDKPAGLLTRGTLAGIVVDPDGDPLRQATVLLVIDNPPDGIHERLAVTDKDGRFRFWQIPAATYDYVFLFDNKKSRLPASILVDRNLAVQANKTLDIRLLNRRYGSLAASPSNEPSRRAPAFLTDDELKSLIDGCRFDSAIWPAPDATEPPALAADVLYGSRAHTTAIRNWLIKTASLAQDALRDKPALSPDAAALLIDLATVYDLNQSSGILTASENESVRSTLRLGAALALNPSKNQLSPNTPAYLALALAAGALDPGDPSGKWLRQADRLYEQRFAAVMDIAERTPSALDRAELSDLLEYAIIRCATGCGNQIDRRLERVVNLAAATLPPDQRGTTPSEQHSALTSGPAFLGLAKTAFAERDFGSRMRALWVMCGSPYPAPSEENSILGVLLTAAAMPPLETIEPLQSRQLTPSAAVLTTRWGTDDELFVQIDGWELVFYRQNQKLGEFSLVSSATLATAPHITRFISTPSYDYLLTEAQITGSGNKNANVYRHILFNKQTGYILFYDEFPKESLPFTAITAEQPRAILQSLLLFNAMPAKQGEKTGIQSSSSDSVIVAFPASPADAVSPDPAPRPRVILSAWDAEVIPENAPGVNLELKTTEATDLIRISRKSAHVAGNVEDDMITGSVGLIRKGETSSELALIDAAWAECGDFRFRLERGCGIATLSPPGLVRGWSSGRSRDANISLGESTPPLVTLAIDDRTKSIKPTNNVIEFRLPSGTHVFSIK